MKHLYYIAALAATFLTAMPLHAQEEAENDATTNASPFTSSQPWGKKR